MATRAIRRRLHHADVDGRKNENMDISRSDTLNEPLLGKYSYDDSQSEVFVACGYSSLKCNFCFHSRIPYIYIFKFKGI